MVPQQTASWRATERAANYKKNPGKREVGRGTGGDPVLPLARSRAGFDTGLCKGLLLAFCPAGLEFAEKEACRFPGHVSSFGNSVPCLLVRS